MYFALRLYAFCIVERVVALIARFQVARERTRRTFGGGGGISADLRKTISAPRRAREDGTGESPCREITRFLSLFYNFHGTGARLVTNNYRNR